LLDAPPENNETYTNIRGGFLLTEKEREKTALCYNHKETKVLHCDKVTSPVVQTDRHRQTAWEWEEVGGKHMYVRVCVCVCVCTYNFKTHWTGWFRDNVLDLYLTDCGFTSQLRKWLSWLRVFEGFLSPFWQKPE
jgi:hypothetical protein